MRWLAASPPFWFALVAVYVMWKPSTSYDRDAKAGLLFVLGLVGTVLWVVGVIRW